MMKMSMKPIKVPTMMVLKANLNLKEEYHMVEVRVKNNSNFELRLSKKGFFLLLQMLKFQDHQLDQQ